jgi:hypothetical protein
MSSVGWNVPKEFGKVSNRRFEIRGISPVGWSVPKEFGKVANEKN